MHALAMFTASISYCNLAPAPDWITEPSEDNTPVVFCVGSSEAGSNVQLDHSKRKGTAMMSVVQN